MTSQGTASENVEMPVVTLLPYWSRSGTGDPPPRSTSQSADHSGHSLLEQSRMTVILRRPDGTTHMWVLLLNRPEQNSHWNPKIKCLEDEIYCSFQNHKQHVHTCWAWHRFIECQLGYTRALPSSLRLKVLSEEPICGWLESGKMPDWDV